jgi:site-specific recombinase
MFRRTKPDITADLTELLEPLLAGPCPTSGDRLAAIVRVVRPHGREANEVAESRMRQLLRLLRSRPDLAGALGRYVAGLLASRSQRLLYAESGVLDSAGFLSGLWRRLLGRMLPPAVDETFLRSLVAQVFDRPRDHEWLAAVPLEDWDALLQALGIDGPAFDQARRRGRQELIEAMRLVSVRLAALGTEPALLRYMPALARHESPFLAQAEEVRTFVERRASGAAAGPEEDRHLEVLLAQCEDYIDAVRRRSREAGVAVDLVFVMARIGQAIERLRVIRNALAVASEPTGPAARERVIRVFLALVRQENRRHSLRDLFRGNVELLARRVTEHASHSGQHYVSRTRDEFVAMYRAAAGAGFIIGAMALVKILLVKLELPLLWEAAAFSLNYGLGFVLIHVLGLTIATKQPAMTAATLAAALDGTQGREARLEALTRLAAEVNRSQWVSIAGNVTVGFLTALAISMMAGAFLGWQPVDAGKASYLLHDLHPWRSLALLHAAIAGVYLFLSGLISGYYDNQALYHRIPERLRRVRWLRRLLGEARLARVADYVEDNTGALTGNFLFGCMLGCTPVVGELLGLPLDIRHVAFASANLAYGLQAQGFAAGAWTIAVSALGVLLIGLVNLTVSFSLAMRVALRSRGIMPEQTRGLTARVLRRFIASPREFIWVPRRGEPATGTAPDAPARR